jgi:hypothetical protein
MVIKTLKTHGIKSLIFYFFTIHDAKKHVLTIIMVI